MRWALEEARFFMALVTPAQCVWCGEEPIQFHASLGTMGTSSFSSTTRTSSGSYLARRARSVLTCSFLDLSIVRKFWNCLVMRGALWCSSSADVPEAPVEDAAAS
jgi:hypothetical protein